MKYLKQIVTAMFAMCGITAVAQSSDGAYPIGLWVTNYEEVNSARFFITRNLEEQSEVNNQMGCGVFYLTNAEGDPVQTGLLNYTGHSGEYFFFSIKTKNGEESKVSLMKYKDGEDFKVKIGKVTGALANNIILKSSLLMLPGGYANGSAYDPTPFALNTTELLPILREAARDKLYTPGFGDVKQFISLHEGVDLSKPLYAKCKGSSAVNLRKKGSTSAEIYGEMTPDMTLKVYDEWNGWLKVYVQEKKVAYVSQSVVTLTNTPGAVTTVEPSEGGNTSASSSSSAAATTAQPEKCPLKGDWAGWIGKNGWGEIAVFITPEKKADLFYELPKVQGNGSINYSDEFFESGGGCVLIFNRSLGNNAYEFTVQKKEGKQIKSGKLQIKKLGNKLQLTGLDAWTKQQPYHGVEVNANQIIN
ncbi:MAG: SH3 domain-containing protein [Prevotella sp.]|nr:SH3 domain-containing protein [Prevotella sp.]